MESELINILIVNRLSSAYFKKGRPSPSTLAKEFLAILRNLGSYQGELYQHLEDYVNKKFSNCVELLNECVPDMSAAERQLFVCLVSGMTYPTICLILDIRRDVLYNRVHRLKQHINNQNTAEALSLLELLSPKKKNQCED